MQLRQTLNTPQSIPCLLFDWRTDLSGPGPGPGPLTGPCFLLLRLNPAHNCNDSIAIEARLTALILTRADTRNRRLPLEGATTEEPSPKGFSSLKLESSAFIDIEKWILHDVKKLLQPQTPFQNQILTLRRRKWTTSLRLKWKQETAGAERAASERWAKAGGRRCEHVEGELHRTSSNSLEAPGSSYSSILHRLLLMKPRDRTQEVNPGL
ncbi:uncharacterized protein V6R79_024903 [Siganus canaliculatus]